MERLCFFVSFMCLLWFLCVIVCVYVWNNCAIEILWLVLNDLCAE